VPDCRDRTCGADGCGGSCGTCSSGDECLDGRCFGFDEACDGCVEHSDCPAGHTCVFWTDNPGAGTWCAPPCSDISDCYDGMYCDTDLGICVLQTDGYCLTRSPGNFCLADSCGHMVWCDPCSSLLGTATAECVGDGQCRSTEPACIEHAWDCDSVGGYVYCCEVYRSAGECCTHCMIDDFESIECH
jgi:hypothetical protein